MLTPVNFIKPSFSQLQILSCVVWSTTLLAQGFERVTATILSEEKLYPEDGCIMFFRNVGNYLPDINASWPRRWQYSNKQRLIFQIPKIQLSGDGVSASFGGYHASAGLGGTLEGGPSGGLFAEAGTPDGTSASAGLGGSVGSGGALFSQASVGGTALAGTDNGAPPQHKRPNDFYDNVFNVSASWFWITILSSTKLMWLTKNVLNKGLLLLLLTKFKCSKLQRYWLS